MSDWVSVKLRGTSIFFSQKEIVVVVVDDYHLAKKIINLIGHFSVMLQVSIVVQN